MSDTLACNHCKLLRIRARAKKEGKIVTLLPDTSSLLGGLNVYVHPKKVKIEKLSLMERETYGGVWFWSLGDRCGC